MVWALSVTETVAYGVLFYSFAVFLVPRQRDLGASTAQLSGALTLAMAVTGVAAPVTAMATVSAPDSWTVLAPRSRCIGTRKTAKE